jgi:hypothetical protein
MGRSGYDSVRVIPALEAFMSVDSEIHFQEGFADETVLVAVDGVEIARFTASTRMQLGLAHIERLRLDPGQTVTVGLPDRSLKVAHVVEERRPFVQVNLEQGDLRIHSTETTPGYV